MKNWATVWWSSSWWKWQTFISTRRRFSCLISKFPKKIVGEKLANFHTVQACHANFFPSNQFRVKLFCKKLHTHFNSWNFRQINILLKNLTVNWFDGKKVGVAVNFSFFHTVLCNFNNVMHRAAARFLAKLLESTESITLLFFHEIFSRFCFFHTTDLWLKFYWKQVILQLFVKIKQVYLIDCVNFT